MIITRTPLRISFFGGGTDLPEFYENYGWGSVLSATIDKYIYISVNKKFGGTIRLSYSKTENVKSVDEVKHPLFREAMKFTGVTEGVEIVSVADVPGDGTGLGSSGAFLVGLLKALWKYGGRKTKTEGFLVEEASHIEREVLGIGAGLQDYCSAVYGGFRTYNFMPNGHTAFKTIEPKPLQKYVMLFYTGVSRKARATLKAQRNNVYHAEDALLCMRLQVREETAVLREPNLRRFGTSINDAWELKKIMAPACTTPLIDEAYEKAMKAGALGGKVCGAGGGGFLMIFCPPGKRANVRKSLSPMKEMPFKFEPEGSKIIYAD